MKTNIPEIETRVDTARQILLNTLRELTSDQSEQHEKISVMIAELDSYKKMLGKILNEKTIILNANPDVKLSVHRLLTTIKDYCAQIENLSEAA